MPAHTTDRKVYLPNDELLFALDSARAVYSQKEKAANALVASIKNLSGALNKVSRALQDTVEQNVSLDSEVLNLAEEALNSAYTGKEQALDSLTPDLRREAKRFGMLTAALRDATNALRTEPVDVVKLDHAYGVLERNVDQDGSLADLIPALRQELDTAQQQLGAIFGSALRHAMAEIGVEVQGQSPRFQLGRFELDANFVTRKASLSYGKIAVAQNIPLSIEGIVRAYQREVKNIEDRAEDGEAWIRQLYEAWERVRQNSGKPRANIVDVFYELVLLRQSRAFNIDPSKRSFRDYSRAQFIHDFVEFAQRQRLGVDGKYAAAHVATKSQADSPSKSMWIVTGRGPHDGDFIADIEFKQD